MKAIRLWSFVIAAALLLAACARSYQPAGSVTPSPFIPSAPSATVPSDTPTVTSTATRAWLPPNFGTPGPTQVTAIPSPVDLISQPGTFNILLAGADRASPSFRTDTLILVNFQPKYDLVTLISIPRDLFVYIPGWQMQRINAAYYHGEYGYIPYPGGGTALLKDTILYNLGIQVDRMALVDFQGFVNIINILGGVDVPVACAYTDWKIINPKKDPEDEKNWKLYTLGPGIVHMNGDKALWYVRSRKKSSDFDRGRRQQEVLRALYALALRLNTLAKLPQLYDEVSSNLTTDMDLKYLLDLLSYATKIGRGQVRSVYINKDAVSVWYTPSGAYVMLPDREKLSALLARALGPPTEVVSDNLVEVSNGSGYGSWPELASERLSYAGFDSVIVEGQANHMSRTILIGLAPQVNEEEIDFLLKSLGLPAASFQHSPEAGSAARYRLILGEDYRPCFDPAKIER